MSGRLVWRGNETLQQVVERLKGAMGEFGLTVEGEAKHELRKGHGVLTSTLQRSIHTAAPGYRWADDHVEPGPGTPERGGQAARGEERGGSVVVEVGSGLRYALPVHQGHGKFGGYHYLTNGLEKAKARLSDILRRWQV